MVPILENAGLQFVGRDETGRRMEVYLRNQTFVATIFVSTC
jgi:hypothetical protein